MGDDFTKRQWCSWNYCPYFRKYLIKKTKTLDNDKLKQAYLERMRQYATKIGMHKTRLLDVRGFALSFSNVS